MSETEELVPKLIFAVRQSLTKRLARITEGSVEAIAIACIDRALAVMADEHPVEARQLISNLTPQFSDLLMQGDPSLDLEIMAEDVIRNLTEAIQKQLSTSTDQSEIVPAIVSQFAAGQDVVQADHQSHALLLKIVISSVILPSKTTIEGIDKKELYEILEFNRSDEMVDFGRQTAAFWSMLNEPRSQVMRIQTPARTGKSTLLKRFMHICEKHGHLYSYINLRQALGGDPKRVLSTIGQHTGLVNSNDAVHELVQSLKLLEQDSPGKKCVLLFDHFEDTPELIPWLVEHLLFPIRPYRGRQTVSNLIVVVAGKNREDGKNSVPDLELEYGWNEGYVTSFYDIRWRPQDIAQFGQLYEVPDMNESVVRFIYRVSEGNPAECINWMFRAKLTCTHNEVSHE